MVRLINRCRDWPMFYKNQCRGKSSPEVADGSVHLKEFGEKNELKSFTLHNHLPLKREGNWDCLSGFKAPLGWNLSLTSITCSGGTTHQTHSRDVNSGSISMSSLSLIGTSQVICGLHVGRSLKPSPNRSTSFT